VNGTEVLVVERRSQIDRTVHVGNTTLTPAIDDDYWAYRVRLSDAQAVVAFPKFFTIGIGFAREEDWNTNLPYTSDASEIAAHIMHNKGDDSIPDKRVVDAIHAIKKAITEDALKMAAES
jgi:hypothetical protein